MSEPQPVYLTQPGYYGTGLSSKSEARPAPGLDDLTAFYNVHVLLSTMENHPTTDALKKWASKKISDLEQYS